MTRIDRQERLRRIVLLVGASGFMTAQLALQDRQWQAASLSGIAAIIGIALWGVALVALVGPWLWGGRAGPLNDERSAAVRARAFFLGYCALMASAAAMFALALTGEIGALEALHLTFSVGVVAPMFGFALLD